MRQPWIHGRIMHVAPGAWQILDSLPGIVACLAAPAGDEPLEPLGRGARGDGRVEQRESLRGGPRSASPSPAMLRVRRLH